MINIGSTFIHLPLVNEMFVLSRVFFRNKFTFTNNKTITMCMRRKMPKRINEIVCHTYALTLTLISYILITAFPVFLTKKPPNNIKYIESLHWSIICAILKKML